MPSKNYTLIKTHLQLTELCKELSHHPWIAVDTEFMREKTYYPELSLIQVATDDNAWCIDPLAVEDLSPLGDILTNREIIKVFHAASQDMEILYYQFNDMPGPIFDTQIAASMLGHGEQTGYANLVKAILDLELEKSQSRTDWSRRPLTEAQLSYAADDVIHLCRVYHSLQTSLDEKGRTQWLQADFKQLENTNNFEFNPDALLKRVKGHSRLRARQLGILRELAVWREGRAKKVNKPRRWVLSDDILIDIARQTPDTLEKLSTIRGIHESIVKQQGASLLSCIERGKQLDEELLPSPSKKKKLSYKEGVLVDILMGIISYSAHKADISPSLLASRKDLEKLITEDSSPLMLGWRYELAGRTIEDFLAGRSSLSMKKGVLTFDTNQG